ncbi:hypothetical protein, partial [Alkalibaculum bacchi]
KWSISMHLMVYFNASGGSKVSIDGPFEMQYSIFIQKPNLTTISSFGNITRVEIINMTGG